MLWGEVEKAVSLWERIAHHRRHKILALVRVELFLILGVEERDTYLIGPGPVPVSDDI